MESSNTRVQPGTGKDPRCVIRPVIGRQTAQSLGTSRYLLCGALFGQVRRVDSKGVVMTTGDDSPSTSPRRFLTLSNLPICYENGVDAGKAMRSVNVVSVIQRTRELCRQSEQLIQQSGKLCSRADELLVTTIANRNCHPKSLKRSKSN